MAECPMCEETRRQLGVDCIECVARASARSDKIDVWEVWPHYDTQFDYLLTDNEQTAYDAACRAAEKFLDEAAEPGEEFNIKIKVKEMTREDYEVAIAPPP